MAKLASAAAEDVLDLSYKEGKLDMTKRLDGKRALITGSTAGCGKACAVRFAAEGARVMVTGRDRDAGEAIVQSIRETGGAAHFFKADVGLENEVSDLMSATVKVLGGLDILVNNAAPTEMTRGPERADGTITDLTTDRLEAIWRPALYGYVWACRFGIRAMVQAGLGGSVVNISSATTLQAMTGMDAYIAAKGAMNSTTRSLAAEFGQYGIRVNTLTLGLIVTSDNSRDMLAHDTLGPLIMSHHLARHGRPEDMANAALFLASDEAAFITGTNLVVDGGLTINSPLNAVFARRD